MFHILSIMKIENNLEIDESVGKEIIVLLFQSVEFRLPDSELGLLHQFEEVPSFRRGCQLHFQLFLFELSISADFPLRIVEVEQLLLCGFDVLLLVMDSGVLGCARRGMGRRSCHLLPITNNLISIEQVSLLLANHFLMHFLQLSLLGLNFSLLLLDLLLEEGEVALQAGDTFVTQILNAGEALIECLAVNFNEPLHSILFCLY